MSKALLFAGVVAGVIAGMAASAVPAQADVTIEFDNRSGLMAIYAYPWAPGVSGPNQGPSRPVPAGGMIGAGKTFTFRGLYSLVISKHATMSSLGTFGCNFGGNSPYSHPPAVIKVTITNVAGSPKCDKGH